MTNKKSETKSNNSSTIYSLRPKRCHICQKMFNPQKYDQHFAICYRFQKEKLDHETQAIKKSRIQIKKQPIRQIVNKGNAYKIIQPKTNSNFRIKNVNASNKNIKNQSLLRDKNESSLFNPEIQRKFRSTSEADKFVIKKQIKQKQKVRVQLKPDYNQQREKLQKRLQKKQTFEKQKKNQEKKTFIKQNQKEKEKEKEKEREGERGKEKEREGEREREIRDIHQRQQRTTHIYLGDPYIYQQSFGIQYQLTRQNNEQLNEHIIQPVAQNHTFINHNLQNQVEQRQADENENSPRNLIQQPRSNDSSSYIASLVSNTAQIINFIQRLNINDQALDIMIEQLNHVNQIAQQVVQLNSLGNSLGFTMETIFGPRIQQLQNAIITQVSMAILRSFNNRLSSQFQQLIDRNPSLRNGFSKQQIQKNFKVQKCQKQGQCPICLQQYPKETLTIKLQCKHIFHDDCIQNWFNSSRNCPMCRQEQKIVK